MVNQQIILRSRSDRSPSRPGCCQRENAIRSFKSPRQESEATDEFFNRLFLAITQEKGYPNEHLELRLGCWPYPQDRPC